MNKKEAIIKAALKLLTLNGVHATPMSAISKMAGTGMGTIYNYFPNKDFLINEIYITIKNQEKSIFVAYNSKEPLRTQFEEYYNKAVRFYIDNPKYFNIMEQLHASPIITKESKQIGFDAITYVVELIESGKKRRIIKNIETEDLIQFIGGTIISYLRLHFQENRKVKPTVVNHLKMVWDAIKE